MISNVQRLLDALNAAVALLRATWYIGRPGEAVPHGFVIKQVRVLILLVRNLLQGHFSCARCAHDVYFAALGCAVHHNPVHYHSKTEPRRICGALVLEVAPRQTAIEAALTATSETAKSDAPNGVNEEIIRTFLHWVFADVSSRAPKRFPRSGRNRAGLIETMMSFAQGLLKPRNEANASTMIGSQRRRPLYRVRDDVEHRVRVQFHLGCGTRP